MLLTAGGSGNTGRDGWLGYVSGELGDDWPVSELEGALTCLAGRVAEMRADPTTHNSRLSDDMNHINPALTGACGRKSTPFLRNVSCEDRSLPKTGSGQAHTQNSTN